MNKATFQACTDVALIKYWGKKNEQLRLPENGSISITLADLHTITTVEFSSSYNQDEIIIDNEQLDIEVNRVIEHLNRIRQLANTALRAKVVSQNNFPKSTGLSSSGSGFAALTLAACTALNLNLSDKEMSILARQASGTACRCVIGGFVEWLDGNTSDTSYSTAIFSNQHWDIRDVVAVVDSNIKDISSTAGHTTAQTSNFYQTRLQHINRKINQIKKFIKSKDFTQFGELIEQECLEFHAILLTSKPSLIAWQPGTIAVMKTVQALRKSGIPAYFTINTGFNVHVLTLPAYQLAVTQALQKLPCVQNVLTSQISAKPQKLSTHLF